MLTLLRQCRVIVAMTLKDHQKKLIPHFHRYNVDSMAAKREDKLEGPYYEDQEFESLEMFDPFSMDP